MGHLLRPHGARLLEIEVIPDIAEESMLWAAASIAEILEYVVKRLNRKLTAAPLNRSKNNFDSKDIRTRMMQNGWCPADIAK